MCSKVRKKKAKCRAVFMCVDHFWRDISETINSG